MNHVSTKQSGHGHRLTIMSLQCDTDEVGVSDNSKVDLAVVQPSGANVKFGKPSFGLRANTYVYVNAYGTGFID